jgi:hypothetical protein
VAFRVTGELSLLDDVERIAYNALPGTMSADMWQHQYLQQANEISACRTNPHHWQSDGPDSTLFGVEPNFGCCTANFNQGGRRAGLEHAAHRVLADPSPPIATPLPADPSPPIATPLPHHSYIGEERRPLASRPPPPPPPLSRGLLSPL